MIQNHHNSNAQYWISVTLLELGFSAQMDNLSEIKVAMTFLSFFPPLFYTTSLSNNTNFEQNQVSLRQKKNVTIEEMDDSEITSLPCDSLIPGCGVSYIPWSETHSSWNLGRQH